jgi:hypothetical protein
MTMNDETQRHLMTCVTVVLVAAALLGLAWLVAASAIAQADAETAKFEAVRASIERADD